MSRKIVELDEAQRQEVKAQTARIAEMPAPPPVDIFSGPSDKVMCA